MTEHFTPSPTKLVRFVNKEGKVVKEERLNRAARRRLGIKSKRLQ
jgi:hypothetical protein